MSWEAMGWVFRLKGISTDTGGYEDYVVQGTDKAVLVVIANYANEKDEAWPSVDLIAASMSIGRRTVQDGLSRMQRVGLVEKVVVGGGRDNTRYKLNVGAGYIHEMAIKADQRAAQRRQPAPLPTGAAGAPVQQPHGSDRSPVRLPHGSDANPVRLPHGTSAAAAPESLSNHHDSNSNVESVRVAPAAAPAAPPAAAVPVPAAPAPADTAPPAAPALALVPTEAAKPKRSRAKPEAVGTRLAPDWRPDADGMQYARDCGLNVEVVITNFVGWFVNSTSRNAVKPRWDMAWKLWCNRDRDEGKNLARPDGTSAGPMRSAGNRPMTKKEQDAAWYAAEHAKRTGNTDHDDGFGNIIEGNAEEIS